MRAHALICSLLALSVLEAALPRAGAAQAGAGAAAQPATPPQATPAPEPAPVPPAGTAAAPAAPAPAEAAPTTPGAASPAAADATAAPAAQTDADAALSAAQQREAGRAQLDRERVRIAAELARRKAQSGHSFFAGGDAAAAEPTPVQHGDAGAPIAIGLSYEQPWYSDAGYDLFADDDVGHRFGVWAAYDVAELRENAFIAIEAGFGTEHAEDDGLFGGTLGSELSTKTGYAGAQLRWVPVSWLQPHARVAGGLAFVDFDVHAGQHFQDDGLSPFASFGLGFTLRTPTRLFEDSHGKLAALSVGLMLEGGYTRAKPLDFDLTGPHHAGQAIPISDAEAGRLDRSGPYARASIVVRF